MEPEKQAPLPEGLSPKACWITLGILVLVHLGLASAIAFPRSFPEWPLMGLVLGINFGQMSLTSAWCAIGPGRLFLRIPFALMAASFSGLTMAAFTLKVFPNDFWFSVALPIVGWFLLQPPLWMFSLGWKYSLQLPESPQQNSSPQMQFTLAHMLLWTLCVALILGISRMALRDVQVSSGPNWRMEDLWPFLIFLIVNFLLAISVTSAMLGLQKLLHRGLAAVTCSLMLGVLHGLCITIMRPGGLSTDGLCSIIWLHFVHGSVLVGSLFVLTAVGYRWQRDAIPPDRAVQSWDASR